MKKTILVVEYDNTVVDTIKEILSHPIFVVTVAEEGQIAKEMLSKQRFDLVITAAMLPKFHGFNLSQFVKETSPQTGVIIISSIYKEVEYKHQALTQYKADDFIEKPLKPEDFKKRIFELLKIRDSDLSETAGPTTAQMPVIDTAKIPIIKKMEEEAASELSSDDLFGDMIDQVDQPPSYEIKLDDENQVEKKGKQSQEVEEIVLPESYLVEKPSKPKKDETDESASQIINKTLVNIFQKEDKAKDTTRLKRIEDDISKKFEDTLSGLGIKSEKKPGPEVHPRRAETVKVDRVKKEEAEIEDEFGNYDILGLIARGGMAEIYKARKKGVKGFEKVLAIKKILSGYGEDDKFVEMFVDEAKIAAELSHPNIVHIYDLGKKDDYYFIAMEYVEGKDLRNILKKLDDLHQTFPEELAIHLTIKILDALSYAHSAKDSRGRNLDIVHRDVSPPNILISFNGEVKLTDFGVSKAAIKMHQTISGALKGKLLYMSPEQANGEKDVDYRSDLYSAGVILYELITGEKLFMDSSEMGSLKKVQQGIIPKPGEIKEDLDPELESIILKALEKDVERRYQNAAAIIKDLESYLQSRFDHMPGSLHLAHFIYRIFRDEINDSDVKIELKPLPYSIRKRPELPEPIESIEPGKPAGKGTADTQEIEEAAEDEEQPFESTIEIDLEASEKIEPAAEISIPLPGEEEVGTFIPRKPEELPEIDIESEMKALKKEERKKGHLWFWLTILIIVAAIAGGLYLQNKYNFLDDIFGGGEKQSPAAVTETPAREKADTPTEAKQMEEESDKVTEESLSPTPPPSRQEPVAEPPKTTPKSAAEIETEKKREPEETVSAETPPAQTEDIQTGETAAEEEPTEKEKETQTTAPVEPKVEEKKAEPVPVKPIIKEGMIATDVDSQPVPISTPLPKVSRKIARQIRSPQTVIVSYLVDHKGKVEKIKFVQKSTIPELNMLITSTIYTWTFKPATKDNKRVKIWMSKPLTFK